MNNAALRTAIRDEIVRHNNELRWFVKNASPLIQHEVQCGRITLDDAIRRVRREQLVSPLEIAEIAARLAERLRPDLSIPRAQLALEFRHDLERIGMTPTSGLRTAVRRLSEFLKEHVYGTLIPFEDLPLNVLRGLTTGGLRTSKASGPS